MIGDRQATDELPFINMTPMVDVMLCLLIFFMAATRLYDWDDEQFNVRVPEVSKAAPLTAAPEDLTILVVEPGVVAVGSKRLDLDELATLLRDARAAYEDQGVQIRGDASLSYQDVADVLAVCEEVGIRRIALPVRPRAERALE